MTHPSGDLRDGCCWRHCPAESDLIFRGVGLCDEHWTQALAVYLDTTEYVRAHVTPAAQAEMKAWEGRE